MDYGFTHDGIVFTPNGTMGITPEENTTRNAEMEQADLARWCDQPDWQLAYYNDRGGIVTTWCGTVIGTIERSRVYRHNFGSRLITLHVRGTNGALYYGRASYDHGTCIHLRRKATR